MAHDEAFVERHENEFTRIWQHVGALGNRMTAVEGTVDRLDEDFYNHGREGLKTVITSFMASFKTHVENQERRRKTNQWRMGIAAIIFAAIITVLGDRAVHVISEILQFQQEFKQSHPSEFKQKSLYDTRPEVYAKDNESQDARIPIVRY